MDQKQMNLYISSYSNLFLALEYFSLFQVDCIHYREAILHDYYGFLSSGFSNGGAFENEGKLEKYPVSFLSLFFSIML